MRFLAITHIALQVPDLKAAERYYVELLDVEVAWRDSGGAASLFATWDEIDAAGAQPVAIMLHRDALNVALGLPESETFDQVGRIGHFGMQVSLETMEEIRARVVDWRLDILHERQPELLTFRDAFGVQWELDTRSHEDPIEIGRQVEARQQEMRAPPR